MPDLETGDMIGLVSSTGPGLVTEIMTPGSCCCLMLMNLCSARLSMSATESSMAGWARPGVDMEY